MDGDNHYAAEPTLLKPDSCMWLPNVWQAVVLGYNLQSLSV